MTVDDTAAAPPPRHRTRRESRAAREAAASQTPNDPPPEGLFEQPPALFTSPFHNDTLFPDAAAPTPPITQGDAPEPGVLTATFGVLSSEEPADPVEEVAHKPELSEPQANAVASGMALSWVDESTVTGLPGAGASLGPLPPGHRASADLLADFPERSQWKRPSVFLPPLITVVSAAAYGAAAALWPLDAVAPTVTSLSVTAAPAPAASFTWPERGSAAVGVENINAVASSEEPTPMASITKVVTVLAALDALPLEEGETGPEFFFTEEDSYDFWQYLWSDQSALDVPVDGSLSEYQLIEGIMLGSANNYADRLSQEIWGSDDDFVVAGEEWLAEQGISGVELENPSGIGWGNTATPRSLLQLAELAVEHPVLGPIVATQETEIPGAGEVKNTNRLLSDPGMLGVKTGTNDDHYNLLSAKEVTIGDATVRIFISVLGQEDSDARVDVTRDLYRQAEAQLHAQAEAPTIAAETPVGSIETPWGSSADIVTRDAAQVVLWNAATPTVDTELTVGNDRQRGSSVGTLSVTGPINTATVDVVLTNDVPDPSLWWRLTHPLELLGLTG
ncbi:D-alanyl-D-alanine carboxypeptidase [Microbacterium sp. YY-01]|uniref:D-alanyl-D-alanine carboxypeptidase family protein n=1 Tax=Microbacterium sp. YY-01 TaxID=3421634 RepID=UPI003D1695C1